MIKKLVMASGLITLALGGATAIASAFVALRSEQMIIEADTVIQGRVVGVESRWDDAGRIVISEARINVHDVLAGTAPSMVTVQTPGGEVGNTCVQAAGFPKFARGQEVILFLKASTDNQTRRVLGHQQGHFEVVTRVDGVTLSIAVSETTLPLVAMFRSESSRSGENVLKHPQLPLNSSISATSLTRSCRW